MSRLLGVGIIGTGTHGSRYANHIIHDLADIIELTAICRRSEQVNQQAAKWQCRPYHDWQQLIADQNVEAIISVMPPAFNYEIAKACAACDKPLLIEKPLAINSTEAQNIVNIFDQKKLGLTVAQTLRYNSIINHLRKELPQIGKMYSFCATHRLEPSILPWLEDPDLAGGGVIFQTAVHLFDALRYITGLEVRRVHASIKNIHNPNLEDLFTAQFLLSDGSLGIVEASKVGRARSGRYEFIGQNGQLQGDQIHGGVEFVCGTETTDLKPLKTEPCIVPLLRDWCYFLAGSIENPIPGIDGLAAVMICDACRESAKKDCWINIKT